MRLGLKFIILVVAILCITLAITSVIYVKTEKRLIEDQLIERGKILGHFVSLIAPGSILAHDYLALNNFIKESTSQRDVMFSVILDKNKNPITSYYDKALMDMLDLSSSDPVTNYNKIIEYTNSTEFILPLTFPILYDEKQLGQFIIGISREEIEQQLAIQFKQRTLGYLLIILLLIVAIYYVFRRSVLVPIKRLVNGSRSVAHGNLETVVEVNSNDELGELTEMFNYMTAEIRNEQEELSRQASFDNLTGLPNRMLAKDRLNVELNRAKRDKTRIAVMFIDLNNFKIINDTMGHATGDQLLIEVSQRMKKRLREGDTIARLGGDEFVVILPVIENISEVEEVAERMMDAVDRPVRLRERDVKVSSSMGVALYPDDGHDVQTLMANADNAMYQAKAAGVRHVRFFSQEMNEEIQNQMHLEQDLHSAIEKGELKLNFQPIVNVATGEYRGAEVLLRWRHPQRGYISPDVFIPLAEMTGQIIPIGEWVIRKAVHYIADWQSRGLKPASLSVNISRVQFQDDLVSLVQGVISEFDINVDQLILEITESVLMENVDVIRSQLNEIDSAGIRLSLDDFGTGYSSLSYLKNFPFHALKLDKSFVDGVPDITEDTSLVSSIIALANGLNLQVVAEGVERQEQLDSLKTMGCDAVQGYHIGHPMNHSEFEKYLQQQLNFSKKESKSAGAIG